VGVEDLQPAHDENDERDGIDPMSHSDGKRMPVGPCERLWRNGI
jgi:hypothetical protein